MRDEKKITSALCLFSGGLDSRLAAKVVFRQGVSVSAVHFKSAFVSENIAEGVSGVEAAAASMGMDLTVEDITEELIALVKRPPHGFGSQLNPCIDCRIMQLKKAMRLMKDRGADFLVTGEVVGQRPMTQRKDMIRHIDREADVHGLVLRPLSAQLLEPTLPEKKQWVDRKQLLSFSGRNRQQQFNLARHLGITHYPQPAGGCRLTDPGYAERLNDLIQHEGVRKKDLPLLVTGRHFRLGPEIKLVVGRKEKENEILESQALPDDVLLVCTRHPGPTSLLRGNPTEEHLKKSARITARYGKGKELDEVEVKAFGGKRKTRYLHVPPAGANEFDHLMI